MKLKTALCIILPLLASTILLAILLLHTGFGKNLFGRFGGFGLRREQTIGSAVILGEIRDMYSFNTVEYVYRVVFPFDFLDPDISIELVLSRLRGASDPIDRVLSPQEYEYWNAWNLARKHRFGLTDDRPDFIVITAVVRGGFDLTGTVWELGSGAALSDIETVIRPLAEDSGRARGIAVRLPRATVTDVVIEDVGSTTYRYPDFPLQPEAWREIAAFVAESVERRTVDEGLLLAAEANGRDFVTTLLQSAGFSTIQFVD